jgi:hypothetical protein
VAQDARNKELLTGRKQHKIGKDGGDFLWKPRPDKGCSSTDDDEYCFSCSKGIANTC